MFSLNAILSRIAFFQGETLEQIVHEREILNKSETFTAETASQSSSAVQFAGTLPYTGISRGKGEGKKPFCAIFPL